MTADDKIDKLIADLLVKHDLKEVIALFQSAITAMIVALALVKVEDQRRAENRK